MKKMRKIFAVLLTLAMVLGMSMTSFAADATKIIVNKLDSGASITYVQIIEPDITQPTGWKFTNDSYLTAFQNVNKAYKNLDAQSIIWKLIKMKTDKATNMPANTTAMTASEFQAALEGISTTRTDNLSALTNGTIEIGNITSAGVYVVKATSTKNYTYSPMAAYVSFDEYDKDTGIPSKLVVEPITAKSKTVDITKESNETDKVVAVGKTVTYKVKTQIPYVSDNAPITKYEIVDTITGANYVTDKNGDVTVTIKVTGATDATVKVKPVNNSITISLTKYLGLGTTNLNKYANAAVEITYDATVTELTVNNSVVPTDGNHNYVPVTDTLYTGTVTLTKTGESDSLLKDAKFVVVKPGKNDKPDEYALVKYVPATDTTDAYYKVTGWTESLDTAKADANLIVTNNNGQAVVKGLDDDVTYRFKEIVAPNGYSINETDARTEWHNAKDATTASNRTGTASMADTKLSKLPSTGGIGTTIFTIAGCIIMIAAAGLFFASRKKSDNK